MDNCKVKTIKCSLNSILNKKSNKYSKNKNAILDAINKVNKISCVLYDYLRIKILDDFENNRETIDLHNRTYLNRLCCHMLNVENSKTFSNETRNFVDTYKLCKLPSRDRTTEILKEVMETMITNIAVNIQERYINHLKKFIKIFMNKELNKDDKMKFYSYVFNIEPPKFDKLHKSLKEFYNNNKDIFEVRFDKYKSDKPLHYNIKISPLSYLKSMYLINKSFEDFNTSLRDKINECKDEKEKFKLNSQVISLFNIIPSKNNYFNNYVPFSTTSLSSLLKYDINDKIDKHIKQNQEKVNNMWNDLFDLNKLNIRKNLVFAGHFETDGIGCSLLFNDIKNKKSSSKTDLPYLNKTKEDLKDKKIVGIDPGKYNLLFMSDGINKLRYTITQRKFESGINRKRNFIDKLKRRNQHIIQIETEMSMFNSKTNYLSKLIDWLKIKYKYYDTLFKFYNNNELKRLKLNTYIKTKQSENKLINNIKSTFGKDCVLVFGDWSDEQGHRTGETSVNKGIKKRLSKSFKSYLIDEYNTSKLCSKCGNELRHYVDKNNKEVYRLLICDDCKNRTQHYFKFEDRPNVDCLNEQETTFKSQIFSRDMNACLNIIKLSEHIIYKIKNKINLGHYARKTVSML